MKLSIIVPVYNVEQYIRKCLLSIINQDDDLFKDIEVIIVNDGTKDKSVEQIQDLIDKFDNIKLINQENKGLSVARNNGMRQAKGDYIWFVDSDDWISRDALSVLMPHLDNSNDIISIAYTKVTENEETKEAVFFDVVKTLSGKETFKQGCEFATMAQRGIYRKEFMSRNNLSFVPGIYSQDDELCLRASYLADKVCLIPQSIYYFLRTVGENHKSIMNSGKPKYGFDYIVVVRSLIMFRDVYIKEADLLKRFNYHISVLINNGLNAISKCSEVDQVRFCDLYKEVRDLNKCLFSSGGKYRIEAILFSIFPNNFKVRIYKLLRKFK